MRRRGRIGGERQQRRNELEELYLRPKDKHNPSSLNCVITVHFIIRESVLPITKGGLEKEKSVQQSTFSKGVNMKLFK